MRWQHPTAQECLTPMWSTERNARPTEFHTMEGAQTSHIQPRRITNDFHIIRQLKKPSKAICSHGTTNVKTT